MNSSSSAGNIGDRAYIVRIGRQAVFLTPDDLDRLGRSSPPRCLSPTIWRR
jgi:hypothetical protein